MVKHFKSFKTKINHFNDWLAIRGTKLFGSMWLVYLFFLYGFGAKIWPDNQDDFLYWSNTVQLWSLPLIIVGQNLLGILSERRSKQTHDMVKEELSMIKELIEELHIYKK
jgi:hypothetical protein